jgi:hypothetical protein
LSGIRGGLSQNLVSFKMTKKVSGPQGIAMNAM